MICDPAAVARLEADLGRIDGVDPCVITIEVANRGASRQIWPNRGPDARWDWLVFDARGRPMGLRWVERGPVTLPAGETLELHAITGSSYDRERWFSAPDGVRAAPELLQISENLDPRRRLRLALR